MTDDTAYAVELRRELHQYPEIGFEMFVRFVLDNQDGIPDLPETVEFE